MGDACNYPDSPEGVYRILFPPQLMINVVFYISRPVIGHNNYGQILRLQV